MSDVSISYKGAEIAALDGSGTKTLLTSGKYCEGDIEVAYTKPSGGGMQLIASGTFTGTGVHNVDIPVGTKMPQTDFIFNCWVNGGTTITPTSISDRVVVTLQQLMQKRFCGFDLSTDGTKTVVSKLTYPTVGQDGATVTNRTPDESCKSAGYARMTLVSSEMQGISSIVRASTGFTIKLLKNTQYPFANGITYNWEIVYFGSDPENDIVEVP